jgi:uncharacterized membrane protein
MNEKLKRFIGIMAVLGILLGCFMVVHEITHSQINKYYGCKENTFWLDWEGANTKCLSWEDGADFNSLLLAQSINEIIGYNVVPAILLLVIVMIVIRKD